MKAIPSKQPNRNQIGEENATFQDYLFEELASLLNVSLKELKEDCFIYEIKKFMSKIGHVNVRFDLPNGKLNKLLINADALNLSEVLLPPVYLPTCKKQSKDNGLENRYSAVIDFPFGESTFSMKKLAVKEGIKNEVKSLTVMLPTMLSLPQNFKELKKQTKKLGTMAKVPLGIGLNATDLTDEQIKDVIKRTEKTKIDFITFVFGDSTEQFVKQRIDFIKKYSGNIKINVLANISSIEMLKEVFKQGINTVYTPYADEIAKCILEKFKIKKIKLL